MYITAFERRRFGEYSIIMPELTAVYKIIIELLSTHTVWWWFNGCVIHIMNSDVILARGILGIGL